MKYYYKIVAIVKGMEKNYGKRWRRRQGTGTEWETLCNQRFFYALCAHHLNGSFSCHIVIAAFFYQQQSHLTPTLSLSPFATMAIRYTYMLYVFYDDDSFYDWYCTHTPTYHIIHKDKKNQLHSHRTHIVSRVYCDRKKFDFSTLMW